MLRRLATGLAAIFTFGRRAAPLIGPAKVIDGDTIVVAGELVRPHGIDAPELGETFQWRASRYWCGTISLAALEGLIAGVKVRCAVVDAGPAWPVGGEGLFAQRRRHRPIPLVSAGL